MFPSWKALCICKHWPRYIKLSLILPASANVAPAVFAFRALSEPSMVSFNTMFVCLKGRHTRKIYHCERVASPSHLAISTTANFLFHLKAEESVASGASIVTSSAGNSTFIEASLQDHHGLFIGAANDFS